MRCLRLFGFVWLLLLADTALAGSSAAKSCGLKRYGSIDFTVFSNEILIPVTVQNTPALMRLHLATGASMLLTTTAQALRLHPRELPTSGVHLGKRPITSYAVVEPFLLGPVNFKRADLLLVRPEPDWTTDVKGVPLVGAIGLDFFHDVDFEIDFKAGRIYLYSQDHCPGDAVYWTDRYASTPINRGPMGNPYFPMEIEGRKIAAVLDTIHQRTSLTTDVTRKLYGFDEHSPDIETTASPDGHTVSQYRAMAITGPGLEVKNARIQLTAAAKDCSLNVGFGQNGITTHDRCIGAEAPLHLGLDVISKLHLYFATKENVLYYTAADAGQKASAAAPDMRPQPPGH